MSTNANLLSIFNYLIAKHGGPIALAIEIEKEWWEYEEKQYTKRNIMPLQRHYTPNEIEFIKINWKTLSATEIALNLKRSVVSVSQRIRYHQKKGELQFKREQNPLPLSLTY